MTPQPLLRQNERRRWWFFPAQNPALRYGPLEAPDRDAAEKRAKARLERIGLELDRVEEERA